MKRILTIASFSIIVLIVTYALAYRSGRQAEKDANTATTLNYDEATKKLTSELQQAQLSQRATRTEMNQKLDSLRGYFSAESQRVIDSLKGTLVAVSEGHGNVSIQNNGTTPMDSTYEDDWLTLDIKTDSTAKRYDIAYAFDFGLHDVTLTTEDKKNVRREIYSVFLQSLRDTTKIMHLGDYERTYTTLAGTITPPEKGWTWSTSFMFGASYSFREHASLFDFGLNLAEYSVNKGTAKGTILKLPTISFATDFVRRFEPGAGIGLNVGHWLPLFADLYVNGTVAYSITADRIEYRAGISTTL